MGITIHYSLKFEGTEKEVLEKLKYVKLLSEGLNFKETSEIFELDYSKQSEDNIIDETYRWAFIQYTPYWNFPNLINDANSNNYKGWVCSCWYGNGCEPTNIGLIRKENENIWHGKAFTKTQYAKNFEAAHMTVCALLKGIEYLGILDYVKDDRNIWKDFKKIPPDKAYIDKRQIRLLKKLKSLIAETPIPGPESQGFFIG